ncbi:protein kinase [Neiella sp. HB171785]|uniref:Protein kinase n=1 Tax=Neiella litorisoli TaxID=2771431 RepID=A0A8J6QGI8_9GAMM|nr:protein kinase [Neiella litorisoli]MBD1388970.1 protein kinase [Neiella litorisoli]
MNIKSAHFLPGTGKRLGDKYLLLDCLGDGTHGWVWRSERLSDNQIVAVKIPKNIAPFGGDRTLAEGKELIGIDPHPNVIQFYEMGRVPPENEWYAIEMEYFPSESLAQKLENRSAQFGNTYKRLFKIYRQVLEAVKFLTELEKPISHGDIKPHNILIGQDDHVKLTDFGSSALPEEIYVRTRENGGTVLYSAPEFCDCVSRKGTFEELLAGDIYSLGVLLYQLVTGILPHDTQAQVLRFDPFIKPTEINSAICKELEEVILTCLQKSPKDRYSSIDDLISQFTVASKVQIQKPSVEHLVSASSKQRDWSSDVVDALENANYQRAAAIAESEYRKTQDSTALLQQLNALYRAERWFDFEKVISVLEDKLLLQEGVVGAHIRIISIKVFMKIRRLGDAVSLIHKSRELRDESFELDLCEASVEAMEAKYPQARAKLENLNKQNPMNAMILNRLVLVCEQERNYEAAAGYLRVAMKVSRGDEKLARKRQQYEMLGVW